jgi:hypothetical protein
LVVGKTIRRWRSSSSRGRTAWAELDEHASRP